MRVAIRVGASAAGSRYLFIAFITGPTIPVSTAPLGPVVPVHSLLDVTLLFEEHTNLMLAAGIRIRARRDCA